MIGTMMITGGILYAGFSTYNHLNVTEEEPKFQIKSMWSRLQDRFFHAKQAEAQKKQEQTMIVEYEIEQQKKLERNFTLAVTALGVTTLSLVVSPTLHLISIPVLIYMGVPSAQEAYDDLIEDHHIGRALIETGFLVGILAQGIYLAGAIGFSSYYLALILKANIPDKLEIIQTQVAIWRNGEQMELPVDMIQAKDVFQVQTGEKVPADGIVIDGIALVDLQWATGEQSPVTKTAGSKISMSTVISVGSLWIECRPS